MALDKLDVSVLITLALALIAYFGKDKLFGETGNTAGFESQASNTSRDIAEVATNSKKNCIIFYGSQTGTAEDYASKLSKDLGSRFGLKCMTADLSEYDPESLEGLKKSTLCFFVMATYGEGEPTDNAVEFLSYLEDQAEELSNLSFCVFGLGNNTYEFYNAIGKKTNSRLEELGAERFAPYGEGDDGTGTMDEDFLSWKDKVLDEMKTKLNLEEHEAVFEPSFQLIQAEIPLTNDSVSLGEPNKRYLDKTADFSKGPFDHSHPYIAPISISKELFAVKDRSCIHAEFDISGSNLRYSTGDHLALWPSNSNENVDIFLKAFGLDQKRKQVFNLKSLDSTATLPFPAPTTYECAVRHYMEISGSVSRQFLLSISQFAPDKVTKERTLRVATSKDLFAEEVHKKAYNIADVLLVLSEGIAWSSVPFEFLIESISHIQPRYYSISSSSLSEKTSIHITAVVESEKIGNQLVTGVATNLLKNIEVSQNKEDDDSVVHYDLSGPRGLFDRYKLPIHVRRSTFKLPSNPSTPVICIGPGTGIAPFRGFVRQKVAFKKSNDGDIGKMLLFYGCRNETEDYLYKNEWPEYSEKLGSKFEFVVAFSRGDPSKKTYVQHKMLERATEIDQLLKKGAFIYVCGDASRMARDVQKSLTKIIATERGLDEDKAAELVRSLKTQNRYQEDVW